MTHVHAYIYHSQIKSPNNLHIPQCKPPNKRDLITAISASFSLQTHYLFAFLLCRLDACYQNRCTYKHWKSQTFISLTYMYFFLISLNSKQTWTLFTHTQFLKLYYKIKKKKTTKKYNHGSDFLQFEIKVGILQWICSCKLCNVLQGPLALFLLVRLVHE